MPHVSRVAFYLGSFPVYWYGIIIALAIGAGLFTASARERRLGFEKDTTISLALWTVPSALIGARLYFVAFSWDAYRDNLLKILDTRSGGMAIYGGVIAGVSVGLIYARVKKLSFPRLCDLAAPALALGQGIGRWANFINQEAYGYRVTNPALCWFPLSVYIQADGAWHLATFFYESVWCLALFGFLLYMEGRGRLKRPGDGFLWYVLLYGLERGVVEGLRTDSLMWGPVRVSQALSLLAALAALTLLIVRKKKGEKGL